MKINYKKKKFKQWLKNKSNFYKITKNYQKFNGIQLF